MYGVITRVELQRVRSRNTTNLESCECLPHAYEYQRLLTPDEHYFARDRLEDVVENDPDYADAWAVPAWIYADVHWGAFDSVPDPLDRALHAATQAVKLAPMHQQARLVLANVHFFRKDLEAFPIAADETLAMSPNDSNVLATIGIRYAYAEQREKGVALVRKAMEINPGHPGWYYFAIAFDRYRDGDYGGAVREAQNIRIPGFWYMQVWLAAPLGQLGRTRDAQTAVDNLLSLYPTFSENARSELSKWLVTDEGLNHYLDGLRKAGLDIPDEPAD